MDEENWITITKPKKSKSGELKLTHENKNDSENEDVLNLMQTFNRNVNKIKLNEKEANLKKKTQIPVKIKQQVEKKKIMKRSDNIEKTNPLPTVYHSLSSALKSLNLSEFRDHLEATKLQFNNNVILLKTALTYLNEKLKLEKTEDSLLFDRPLDYPNNILPLKLKALLSQVIEQCNGENLQYFFNSLLHSLCDELNKNRNFIGHLIMLQQIAHFYPEVCLANLASTVILRNSYQNQSPICLSLFWTLCTSGFVSTSVALRVWMEIISSVINVKTYTKFAFNLLEKILLASTETPALNLSLNDYKMIVNLILDSDLKAKMKDGQNIKGNIIDLLSTKFISSVGDNPGEYFLIMLKYSKRNPELFVHAIVEELLEYPEETIEVWENVFDDYKKQHALIFCYIENNLDKTSALLDNKTFLSFVKSIDYSKYPHLLFFKDIPAKMSDNKKQKKQKKGSGESSRSSCCKWFFGSIFLFSAIAGLIAYDTNVLHDGKFEESSVGRVLKQTGALPHVENAWFVSLKYSARGYKWIEEQAPVAYSKTRTFMEPYCDFTKDLALTALNVAKNGWESTKIFFAEKTPVVISFIDKYVPGLGQKIQDFTANAAKGFCSLTCNGWRHSVEFFKTKVFIGQLSPENIGKAFNSTTQRALTYYSWFHEKVDFYAKVK
ncbi:CLUMA_CG007506, isoform A [Clunio marinus]|uniref:CLUMA_CG007506, isoform A n=1 Tax=Clunio marinus TaxID=568069 RepID=A0A1J1I312_9DIPT|nr:CLUMA_CG007506, isoform A [Clunio marinus]